MTKIVAPAERQRRLPISVSQLVAWLPALLLAPIVAAQLLFFAVRVAHLLGYPFPLDYGEGPLLAQVRELRAGTPIWALYGDPGAPPYAVVNYPPVYHLATLALSLVTGGSPAGVLLAGRLVSLLATLGCVAALWALSGRHKAKCEMRNEPGQDQDSTDPNGAGPSAFGLQPSAFGVRLLVVLAFLGVPIVREWAALMRVDMLGVCLGLWGLALVRRVHEGRASVPWPALLLALSLLVKPSLLAAPAAALLWLLFRDWRLALRLGLALGAFGGGAALLLQITSGGWFLTHIVAANANPIDRALGASFWDAQLDILRPLFAAGALGGALGLAAAWRQRQPAPLLPISYALFGALVALGVGKVGAYLNYFLELYAGLVWLAAGTQSVKRKAQNAEHEAHYTNRPPAAARRLRFPLSALRFLLFIVPLLVAASLLRYVPLWSETYLKPYGLIEGQSPPRVAFGSYGVWADLRREAEVLGALGRVNAALVDEVRAAGAPIFTDLPGIAAQAGQRARHQAFEHRQLYDVGLWDQRPLLRDMASGRVPLVALDYLGNWLTPEMIALITHRYAQDGSRGPYDLYRPVDPGPLTPAALEFPGGLRVTGARLTPPGGAAYSGGELLAVTLELAREDQRPATSDQAPSSDAAESEGVIVVLQLVGADSAILAESERPLLYGALPPDDWGGQAVQHMQPLALPPVLPPGTYTLAATLRAGGADLAPAHPVARLTVGELSGRVLGEGGYFVPAPLLEAWALAGGYDGPGDPITPAVPFEGFTAQCFQRACYRLVGGEVQAAPLEELIGLALTAPRDLSAANLGEEFLRLPGGVPYRWP